MPRHRRRRVRTVAISRPKYSSENVGFSGFIENPGTSPDSYGHLEVPIIPPMDAFGRRKCKYFTLTISALYSDRISGGTTVQNDRPLVYFALVFVPEGTVPNGLNLSSGNNVSSYYEPNQNVIMQGCFDSKTIYRFRSRLSRNLNSNDSIYLVVRDRLTNGSTTDRIVTQFTFTVNYAISF